MADRERIQQLKPTWPILMGTPEEFAMFSVECGSPTRSFADCGPKWACPLFPPIKDSC
jgi:hypothetical protein